MPASPFSAEIRLGPHATVASIVLHGELNAAAEANLNEVFVQATSGPVTAVTLNFSDVTFMNSTGIALIVGLLSEAQRDGRELRALGLSQHYREIFDITRLSDFIRVLDDGEAGDAAAPPPITTSTATPTTTGGQA